MKLTIEHCPEIDDNDDIGVIIEKARSVAKTAFDMYLEKFGVDGAYFRHDWTIEALDSCFENALESFTYKGAY